MLIDIHAHLHVKEFDADRAQVIERACKAGITKMIDVGFDVEGNFAGLALAQKYDFMYASMGIHPHCVSEWNEAVGGKIFEAAKKENKIVALGEMGLDYYKNFQPKHLQQDVFRAQLKLARQLQLPVIIHCRDAFEDAFKILKEEKIERALFHCFTGIMDEAQQVWKRGYAMAFTGIITYPSAAALRAVVKKCPLERLFIETDCPFLAPQEKRGQRNEPAFVSDVFNQIVAEKKLAPEDFSNVLLDNFAAFFQMPQQVTKVDLL